MLAHSAAYDLGYVLGYVVILGLILGGATMFFVTRARRRRAQGKRWYL